MTEEPQSTPAPEKSPKDCPKVPVLPPIIILLFLIAGIVLDWLVPVNFGHGWGALGLILLGVALSGIFWCKLLFDKAETNVNPMMPTLAIVTEGPYKYSRNPIYVCFLIGYAGLAMLADAPVMLLLLAGLYYILERYVIIPEEDYLAAKFGETYRDYKAKTRRWV